MLYWRLDSAPSTGPSWSQRADPIPVGIARPRVTGRRGLGPELHSLRSRAVENYLFPLRFHLLFAAVFHCNT